FEDGMKVIESALQANPQEKILRPEMLRLRGQLQSRLGHWRSAEVDFRESIARARDMGAKSWELRTTTSLAKLLRNAGRTEEARATLAEICDWFTEGFDTADLKDAKALLYELGG